MTEELDLLEQHREMLPALLRRDAPAPEVGSLHCVFECVGERCAVAKGNIAQVLEVDSVTELPLVPEHVRGVVFHENSVLPVVQLAHDGEAVGLCAVLKSGNRRLGLVITSALGFRSLDEASTAEVEPPPTLRRYVDGVRTDGDTHVFVLSVESMLSELRPTGITDRRPEKNRTGEAK